MRHTLVLFILYSLFSGYLFSQVKPSTNQYLRLKGQYQVESWFFLHLVRVGDSLYGDLIPEVALWKLHIPAIAGKPMMVGGKVDQKGNFTLNLWPSDPRFVLTGKLTPKPMDKGFAANLKLGVRNYPVTLQDVFPNDTRRLMVLSLKERQQLLKDNGSPSALVNLSLILPVTGEKSAETDSLRRSFTRNFTPDYEGIVPEEILKAFKTDFFQEYVSGNASLYKEMPGASFEWELIKYMHVVFNQHDQISLFTLSYDYTGGAHGLETRTYSVIDVKTGRTILLNGIFKPGYKTELTTLLTRKLKQDRKIHPNVKLTDSGYFMDEITPTEDFYITGNGIGFYYNPYDIAPYSFGGTDIFLPYSEIRALLKKP